MKGIYNTLLTWKVVALLLPILLNVSCADDTLDNPREGIIGFSVSSGSRESDEFRSSRGDNTGDRSEEKVLSARVLSLEDSSGGAGKPLYLHAIVTGSGENNTYPVPPQEKLETRAAPVTTASMHPSFGVLAYVYPASGSWTESVKPDYMYNTKVESPNWSTTYHWPGTAWRIRFFAYAPHDCHGLTLPPRTATGTPEISYTVPDSVAQQQDLLVVDSDELAGDNNVAVPLAFKHALAAIRFVVGDDMLPGKITRVTLKDVHGSGKHKIGSATWSDLATKKNFSQTIAVTENGTPGTEITGGTATFMMIPQELPTTAKIEVIFIDQMTNTTRTLTASLAGSTWEMGKTLTYRISTNSIVVTPQLEVTALAAYTYQGGSKTYSVKSYLEVTRPGDPTKTIPAPWTAEFSTDNGASWTTTPPAWLTTFSASGTGSNTPTNYNSNVAAQASVSVNTNDDALKAASPVSDYNLSNSTGSAAVENTANCYLVNAPGTYKLPLVYGNAIKNNATNSNAYISSRSGHRILKNFINHLDQPISDPYIYNNSGCIPENGALVWQDEKDLVTNIALSSDGHFLTFTVNQATIKQGNAIIAVRDASNEIMWSWHIWVTDYKLGDGLKTVTNFQNVQYTFLPLHIGWCEGNVETYAEREVKIRFKQKPIAVYTTSITREVIVKQNAHVINHFGNSPYFQFGRKDPMPPGLVGNKNKPYYSTDYSFSSIETPESLGKIIKNPHKIISKLENLSISMNSWSANFNNSNPTASNDDPVVKTVYDPSPVGYSLPPGNAFTGFITTADNHVFLQYDKYNVQGSFNKGWNFYCGPNRTGETIFFHAAGFRSYADASYPDPGGVGIHIRCWTSNPRDYNSPNFIHLGSYVNAVSPRQASVPSVAMSVRPIREE